MRRVRLGRFWRFSHLPLMRLEDRVGCFGVPERGPCFGGIACLVGIFSWLEEDVSSMDFVGISLGREERFRAAPEDR